MGEQGNRIKIYLTPLPPLRCAARGNRNGLKVPLYEVWGDDTFVYLIP